MRLSIVVATAENGVIGRDGQLPWRLLSDLKHFRALTMGHHLIMGRKTFDSIGRPLPGRTTIVLTRRAAFSAAGVCVAGDLDTALQQAGGDEEVFVVGGGDVYQQALPRAQRVYRTLVHTTLAGDTRFPDLPRHTWQLIEEVPHRADARNEFDFTFQIFERVRRDEHTGN